MNVDTQSLCVYNSQPNNFVAYAFGVRSLEARLASRAYLNNATL